MFSIAKLKDFSKYFFSMLEMFIMGIFVTTPCYNRISPTYILSIQVCPERWRRTCAKLALLAPGKSHPLCTHSIWETRGSIWFDRKISHNPALPCWAQPCKNWNRLFPKKQLRWQYLRRRGNLFTINFELEVLSRQQPFSLSKHLEI